MKFYRLASGFPTKSGSLLPTKRGRELPTLTAAVWPLLDEKTRYLLNGKYVLKKSAKELADDLKMPPDNIRMALVRAKRKARKAMADMAPA